MHSALRDLQTDRDLKQKILAKTSQTGKKKKKIILSEKQGRDGGTEECEAIDGRMMRCLSYRRKTSLWRSWMRRGIIVQRGKLLIQSPHSRNMEQRPEAQVF